MKVVTTAQTVGRLISQSIMGGGQHNLLENVEIDWAGDCTSPVTVWMNGRPIVDHPKRFYANWARHADLRVRCRKCRECLRHRARKWAFRCQNEIAVSQRTWFVTLTLSPDAQHRSLTRARKAYLPSGDLDAEGTDKIFRMLHRDQVREITLWLKRLRKVSGAELRYAIVAEAHKSGLPHYHALVHEVTGSGPVLHRHISSSWKAGFSSAKLVTDGGSARYVTKYLAKSSLARVRASGRYGHSEAETDVPSGALP